MTIPAIGAIGGVGAGGSVSAALSAATMPSSDPTAASGASGSNFADMLSHGINAVQASQTHADNLAIQAATGDLTNVADYTIAATQASLMTSLASTVRSKAVAAFNEVMGMQA